MDWIKAIQIGFYILQKITEFMSGGATEFSFDVSVKGVKHRVIVRIDKYQIVFPKANKDFK